MSTIFFILSKVAQFCIEPLNWVLVFILLSLLFFSLSKLYLVKRFLTFALISLLIIGYLPTSEVFLNALENASPKISLTHVVEKDIGGIIILGGAVRGGLIGSNRNEVSLESSAIYLYIHPSIHPSISNFLTHLLLRFLFLSLSLSLSLRSLPSSLFLPPSLPPSFSITNIFRALSLSLSLSPPSLSSTSSARRRPARPLRGAAAARGY